MSGRELHLSPGRTYPSSFLSGTFGRLATKFGAKKVLGKLILKSDDEPLLKDQIRKIILEDVIKEAMQDVQEKIEEEKQKKRKKDRDE